MFRKFTVGATVDVLTKLPFCFIYIPNLGCVRLGLDCKMMDSRKLGVLMFSYSVIYGTFIIIDHVESAF